MTQKAKRKRINEEHKALLRNIYRTKYDLECAMQNFDFATDPMLIDMYTYQIKAYQAQYQYLLGRARENGITENSSVLVYTV
ncbi:MAG: YaaL family protein [Clostridia bacterium]|nr:YaaL family protein [Clostridia bacterium]